MFYKQENSTQGVLVNSLERDHRNFVGSFNQSHVPLGKFCRTLTPLGFSKDGKFVNNKNNALIMLENYWRLQYPKPDKHRSKLTMFLEQC